MIPAEFGSTLWGRAWVRTVGATAASGPNALLPKARSLARNHAVMLTTDTGRVEAEVASSGVVHRVRIELPVWSEQTQAEVARMVAKSLAESPGLIPGDLPDALEADLRGQRISLAVSLAELRAQCGCRGRKRPCVHILATIYALAQLIDERPMLALELRCAMQQILPTPDTDWVQLTALDPVGFYGGCM